MTAEEREFLNRHVEEAAYYLERMEAADEAWQAIERRRKTAENLDDVLGEILKQKRSNYQSEGSCEQ